MKQSNKLLIIITKEAYIKPLLDSLYKLGCQTVTERDIYTMSKYLYKDTGILCTPSYKEDLVYDLSYTTTPSQFKKSIHWVYDIDFIKDNM